MRRNNMKQWILIMAVFYLGFTFISILVMNRVYFPDQSVVETVKTSYTFRDFPGNDDPYEVFISKRNIAKDSGLDGLIYRYHNDDRLHYDETMDQVLLEEWLNYLINYRLIYNDHEIVDWVIEVEGDTLSIGYMNFDKSDHLDESKSDLVYVVRHVRDNLWSKGPVVLNVYDKDFNIIYNEKASN